MVPNSQSDSGGSIIGVANVRSSARSSIVQLIEKPLRCDQIGGAEPLREAVVDRLQAADGLGLTALVGQQAGEARGGTQLPPQSPLLVREIERLPEEVLRPFCDCRSPLQSEKFALQA